MIAWFTENVRGGKGSSLLKSGILWKWEDSQTLSLGSISHVVQAVYEYRYFWIMNIFYLIFLLSYESPLFFQSPTWATECKLCVCEKKKKKKHDIESTIKRLKNNKIPGKNGFHAELLCTSNKSSRHWILNLNWATLLTIYWNINKETVGHCQTVEANYSRRK